jgi:hypothetical protein
VAGASCKTTIVEGGNGLATAAAGVMERIGEIEAAPQASQGLLHGPEDQLRPVAGQKLGARAPR